jgi:hypothetical protein
MVVRPSRLRSHRAWPAVIVACLVLTGLLTPPSVTGTGVATAATCPPGFMLYADLMASEARGRDAYSSVLASTANEISPDLCINLKHPESDAELMAAYAGNTSETLAPAGALLPGALKSAVAQREAIRRQGTSNAAWRNGWRPAGNGPLIFDDPRYPSINGLGYSRIAGRISDFEWVPERNALYAAASNGGVWKSTNKGLTWKSVGESLPTQLVGSVAWTPASGGTLLVLTGDQSFGFHSYEGFGAFYSTNDGKTWKQSRGVPEETFGFKIVVDPTNPREIYAATGAGLFRSTDAGRSFTNVKLPTGECAGKGNRVKACLLANIVTDVVVQHPGGINEVAGGVVVAAVGWRAGAHENPDGTVQSPNNGIYISADGAPGSFEKAPAPGFAPQPNIGRVEMGVAYGPDQDHNFLYAIVGDAKLQMNPPYSEFPDLPPGIPPTPTKLNGIYVSPDFGQTWTLMASAAELVEPQTGSSLPVVAALGVAPGVQAWYNLFIQPDPTTAAPGGAPTRLVFGLEEVWQNEVPTPQVGKTQFKVIGRYYSGTSCLFLTLATPVCPTDREGALEVETTTHADQHAVVFIPEANGGVTMVEGNDGGVHRQTVGPGEEFANNKWGRGSNDGFNTLQPYHAVLSKDGTIWMGMQDNGTGKVDPKDGKPYTTQGGDGHFVAVDPHNSNIAFGETPFAGMFATADGGRSWSNMNPPVTNAQFSNQFVMDPRDSKHLVTAGRQVVETESGGGTGSADWKTVFDLGTQDHPGDAEATPAYDDPVGSMTSLDAVGPATYVGFCYACDVLNNPNPFRNGIATNIGGTKPPITGTSQGWHFARARGLPNRIITGVAIDPRNARTVYVSLGGYGRRWTPPGSLDDPSQVGKGHVYVSTDAGNTFRNISGNLPDARVMFLELRGDEIIAAGDVGVFIKKRNARNWALLGRGLPNVPVHSVEMSPVDRNLLVVATHGRGPWTYRFGPPAPYGPKPVVPIKLKPIKGRVIGGPFTFEVDEENWTVQSTGLVQDTTGEDVALHEWRRRPPGNVSAFSFAVQPYTDESATTLYSPAVKHGGGTVELSWFELMDTESCCDYVTVEWSSDGALWTNLDSYAGLNPGFPQFSEHVARFAAPKGQVFVRFRLTSDQLISFPANQGVAIDDVTFKA